MVDYNKYKLTEEEIKTGVEDFFSQLMIEAKRRKIGAKKLEDLSSDEPKLSYVVGQPGAGKTTLSKNIQRQYKDMEECVVEIGSDKIATYHRDYNELLTLMPEDCYAISRQFTIPAGKIISETIRRNKINIVREISLSKGEKDYNDIKVFKDDNYNVEINIIAVDKFESFLSCIERDIKLMELGYDPRPVARINHDRMYDSFLQELIEIQKRKLCDKVNVYRRGKALNQVELVYSTGDTSYATAQDAIISERGKNRKQLLSDSQDYLERLKEAREKVKVLVQDKKMQENYLDSIDELEVEFLQEMVFERRFD